ncbi:MAG: hypothetical protein QOI08_1099, partial [Actinomycetota bacterium]|nr:hypothetical protein [Actinomycetota bacterium]
DILEARRDRRDKAGERMAWLRDCLYLEANCSLPGDDEECFLATFRMHGQCPVGEAKAIRLVDHRHDATRRVDECGG